MADSTCSTGTQAGASCQGVAAELAASSGYAALEPGCTSYATEWFSGMTVKGYAHPPTAAAAAVYLAGRGLRVQNVDQWGAAGLQAVGNTLQAALGLDDLQRLSIVAAVTAAAGASGGVRGDGGGSAGSADQQSDQRSEPQQTTTDVQANHAQQDAEVYALVTAWFGSIEPPPGPGDSFEDLARTAEGKQGVESTVRSAWAAVQSIAAQMPGRPCNWTETTIRTKMRERHRFLKDRQGAIRKAGEYRKLAKERKLATAKEGGASAAAATGSNGAGGKQATPPVGAAHIIVPTVPTCSVADGAASVSDSDAATGDGRDAASPAEAPEGRIPSCGTGRRTRSSRAQSNAGKKAGSAKAVGAVANRNKRGEPTMATADEPGGRRTGLKRARRSGSGAAQPPNDGAATRTESENAAAILALFGNA